MGTEGRREAAFRSVLEAFAVGDAFGMPTEFMTRAEIARNLAGADGLLDGFVEPERSRNHPNLGRARITDDTEQVVWLLEEYLRSGEVSAEGTARALLSWVRETGAVEKRYIGPSSMAALRAIEGGAHPRSTGSGGRTCGGIMRSPAAVLFALARGRDLGPCVHESCLPTHDSSTALEAALAYGRALAAALEPEARERGPMAVIEAALAGADEGRALAPWEYPTASLPARIVHLGRMLPELSGAGELLDFLGGVYGTGLESADVAAAVFGIFMRARGDAWLAIRMGASIGGDTDTIAALAGALSAAFAGGHDIPPAILGEVLSVNALDFGKLARRLVESPQG